VLRQRLQHAQPVWRDRHIQSAEQAKPSRTALTSRIRSSGVRARRRLSPAAASRLAQVRASWPVKFELMAWTRVLRTAAAAQAATRFEGIDPRPNRCLVLEPTTVQGRRTRATRAGWRPPGRCIFRALGLTAVTVDALVGVDVQHPIELVGPEIDARDGTDIDAGFVPFTPPASGGGDARRVARP
jgi:hypothetical protein